MKKLLAAALLLLGLCSEAAAQNPQCPTRPPGDNTNACASTAFVQQAVGGGGGGGGAGIIDVSQFGVVCNATGSVDNRIAFKNLAAFVNANPTSVINFPPGPTRCGVWPMGTPIASQDALFDLSSITGLTVNMNGSCISSTSVNADWTDFGYVWLFRNAQRITLNNPCYLQNNTGNPTSLLGANHIQFIGTGHTVVVRNGVQNGGATGFNTVNTDLMSTFRGITINGFSFDGIYNPLGFRQMGDDVTITGVYSKNHERFYFPQNVSQHFVRATITASGLIIPEGMVLGTYCGATWPLELKTTQDIDFGLDILDPGTTLNGNSYVTLSFLQIDHLAPCSNAIIRNIKVNLSVAQPNVAASSFLVTTLKAFADGFGNDSTVRNYIFEGIDISGKFALTSSDAFRVINLFDTSFGNFTGETLRDINIHDVVVSGPASTIPDIVIDGVNAVTGLKLSNIVASNGIVLTNTPLAYLNWDMINSPLFTVNGVAKVNTSFGAGSVAANIMPGNWTGATANVIPNTMPNCPDVSPNHLNYVPGTGIICGTSGGGAGGVSNVATTPPIAGGPITSTGTISCPTCVTGSALTSGSLMVGAGAQASAVTTTGTGIVAALGVNVGSPGAPVILNGVGGTPSSLTLTNATGLPTTGLVDNAVTNVKLAAAAANTVKGNFTGGAANVADNAVPSCSAATTSALIYTSGTGLGCRTDLTTNATAAVGQLPGTTTNDNAAAGKVGEYVASTVASANQNALTTGTPANIGTGTACSTTATNTTAGCLSLTAGDWEVDGVVYFTGPSTTTVALLVASISTTSAATDNTVGGNSTAAPVNGVIYATSFAYVTLATPSKRVSLASTTNVFLVARSDFATSTSAAYGIIRARRVR